MRNRTLLVVLVIGVIAASAMLPGAAAAAGVDTAGAVGPETNPHVAGPIDDGAGGTKVAATIVVPLAVGIGIAVLPISFLDKVLIGLSLTFAGVSLIVLLRTRSVLKRD